MNWLIDIGIGLIVVIVAGSIAFFWLISRAKDWSE